MYLTMFIICFVIGLITTYKLRNVIIEEGGDDFLPTAFLDIAKEGYEDTGDILVFVVSLFLYLFCLSILSALWFIAIPVALIFIIIKKSLKKKS